MPKGGGKESKKTEMRSQQRRMGVIDSGSGKASLKRHWSRDPKMREQARKIFGENVPEREMRSAGSLRWERVPVMMEEGQHASAGGASESKGRIGQR